MNLLFQNKQPRYSDHLDTIIALVTHLGYSEYKARTSPNLAKALSIPETEITLVLEMYKSLFRKSDGVSKKTGAPFYALQLRHAIRWVEEANEDAAPDEQEPKPALDHAQVNALLDFVVKKADHESRTSLGHMTAWVTASASLIVAFVAIVFRK